MADAALKGQGAERSDPAFANIQPAMLPQEDGGVVVD